MDLWVSSGDRSPWWTHSPHGRAAAQLSGPAGNWICTRSCPVRSEATFSSNTTWAGRTRSLQQRPTHVTMRPGHSPHPPHLPGLCLWVPSRRGGLAKPGTAGPRAFLDRAGCLSLGNPADWPKRAGRNSHWGNDRAQSPTAAARVPTHRGLHVPALMARPGRGAHCPRPPPAGIQGPHLAPSGGVVPAHLLSHPGPHLPLSTKTQKPPCPCPPGKALHTVPTWAGTWPRGSQSPSWPWPAKGDTEP